MTTAQSLLKKFKKFKTLPHLAIHLSQLISNEYSTVYQLEEVIRLDPTLVLRLMRLVNSSYYGLQQKVDSISRAVIFVGMKNLRNMIVIEALKDIFKNSPDEQIFSRRQLWLHCAAVSICSQMISERIFGINGEDAFLCGILHDVGMIVEDQAEHDLFCRACKAYKTEAGTFTEHEKEIIGTDHCTVGYLLSRDWKLPPEVQQGIKQHHSISENISSSRLIGIIQLAEYIVGKLGYEALPGMHGILSPPLIRHIHDNVEEYKTLTKDLPEELSKARELYDPHES
jgi:putative nucleotidyltransferase with HDIG domain